MKCRVISSSMVPLLRIGDEIEVISVSDGRVLKRFDVIVFNLGAQPFCHFVWNIDRSRTPWTLTTRSLSRPTIDDHPVSIEDVLGLVQGRRLSLGQKLYVVLINWIRGTA